MKILVLQLARFGDIYLSWPALRALRRKYPDAQIDLLVRSRFSGATEGLNCNINVLQFETSKVLKPQIFGIGEGSQKESLFELDSILQPMINSNYNRVINFSFSPLSSYLTSLIAQPGCEVSGYTRHDDGHLNIPDDSSAYFYAQVGIDKKNRFHLTQIFASVAGVELASEDWGVQSDLLNSSKTPSVQNYLVYHVGASVLNKTYSPFKVAAAFKRIQKEWTGSIVLVGSENEQKIARQIVDGSGLNDVINLVGKTSLMDLFAIVKGSQLVLGADSAPIHIASHTLTPVLNLSFANVNFWETGPCSPKSRVLWAEDSESMPSDFVAREALAMLKGEGDASSDESSFVWHRDSLLGTWKGRRELGSPFQWKLIQAIYTGEAFPPLESKNVTLGMRRLRDLTHLAIAEMSKAQISATSLEILEQVDQLYVEIPKMVPELQPLVDWFQTERVRISPGTSVEVLERTLKVFARLAEVLDFYEDGDREELKSQTIQLCQNLAGSLSEWDLKTASTQLEEFLELCRRLASISPKVGDSQLMWSHVLREVESGYVNKQYLKISDYIQYEISPALENWVS